MFDRYMTIEIVCSYACLMIAFVMHVCKSLCLGLRVCVSPKSPFAICVDVCVCVCVCVHHAHARDGPLGDQSSLARSRLVYSMLY